VIPEYIQYYDVETGTLDTRPIGTAYGVTNMYQDVSNTEDINELEKKLSLLEQFAAKIIEDVHNAADTSDRTFSIYRPQLQTLRKFLFVMHYRAQGCSEFYFDSEHPENHVVRGHFERLKAKTGAKTKGDLWLHTLRYYLDTSPAQIAADAAPNMTLHREQSLEKLTSKSEPESGNLEAIAYQGLAACFHLSIVEAAPGTEFILTPASFGMFEGTWDANILHRLFFVSPRIALILRNNITKMTDTPRFSVLTEFGDVPFEPPVTTYAHTTGVPTSLGQTSEYQQIEEVFDYQASSLAKEDCFNFKIIKLSKEQTHKMNVLLLLHTEKTGSVSFLSYENMLEAAMIFRMRRLAPNYRQYDPLIYALEKVMDDNFVPIRKKSSVASPEEI
jgi:hypothetical protein